MRFENTCDCGTEIQTHEDTHTLLTDFHNKCDKCGKENTVKFVHFTDKKVQKK